MTAAVIGGGAAGLMACAGLSERHDKVYLFEKNKILAKKLRITGKGRCNITNSSDLEYFFKNIPTNPKFMYSALYTFTNDDMISFIEELGVKTKNERGNRVFPVSDNANDVADALAKKALAENVVWIKNAAEDIVIRDGRIAGVKTRNGIIKTDSVVVATGGVSYPATGSTGDGYKFAKKAGHTIIAPKASLVPIETEEKWVRELMGLSLKNVELSVYNSKNKRIFSDFGEMLFTHFGISGPIALSASSHIGNDEKYGMLVDLKPALDSEKLDKRLVRDFEKYSNKHIINGLDDLLPKALIPVVIRLSEIDEHKPVNSMTRGDRHSLVRIIKALPLTVKGLRPVSEAIITSGGVKVSEIEPSTMESKLVKGLYFAGEVIDVDAYTGGFNLQIAFSTGHLAGANA